MKDAAKLKILPMGPSLRELWLDFFDGRAFSDNPEWKHCYCTFYHKPEPGKGPPGPRTTNRKRAISLIDAGLMPGYLGLDEEGRAVAWCAAGDRTAFARLGEGEPGKILAVLCFVVQKDWRRKGAAAALLARVVAAAAASGFESVEAYPNPEASSDAGNYRGPAALYAAAGFLIAEEGGRPVARKRLAP